MEFTIFDLAILITTSLVLLKCYKMENTDFALSYHNLFISIIIVSVVVFYNAVFNAFFNKLNLNSFYSISNSNIKNMILIIIGFICFVIFEKIDEKNYLNSMLYFLVINVFLFTTLALNIFI